MASGIQKLDKKFYELALKVLDWSPEEAKCPLEGSIFYVLPEESDWHKTWRREEMTRINGLLLVQSSDELPTITKTRDLLFPSDTANIKDAFFILIKEEDSILSLVKEPLALDNCVICRLEDWKDCFEIQEFINKESLIFMGEDPDQTDTWFEILQYYSQSMGGWRKRRRGLGHIVIDANLVVPHTPATTPISMPGESEGAVGLLDTASLAADALKK